MNPREVETRLVSRSPLARKVNEDRVEELAESIREIGLLHPIWVRPRSQCFSGTLVDGYEIIAGNHRFEAMRQLGAKTIPVNVIEPGDDLEAHLRVELITIDENLLRENLTPTQEAAQIVRRKQIYERLHPETKLGTNQHTRVRKNCEPTDGNENNRFTLATAKATGKSERAVQLAARRGEALGAETLKRIAGTSLDKGIELDALVKKPPREREKLIERAARGEKVSAASPSTSDKLRVSAKQNRGAGPRGEFDKETVAQPTYHEPRRSDCDELIFQFSKTLRDFHAVGQSKLLKALGQQSMAHRINDIRELRDMLSKLLNALPARPTVERDGAAVDAME